MAEFLETFRNKVIRVVESENYIKISCFFQRTSKIPKNQYFSGFCYHSETWRKYRTFSVVFRNELRMSRIVQSTGKNRKPVFGKFSNFNLCGLYLWSSKIFWTYFVFDISQDCLYCKICIWIYTIVYFNWLLTGCFIFPLRIWSKLSYGISPISKIYIKIPMVQLEALSAL